MLSAAFRPWVTINHTCTYRLLKMYQIIFGRRCRYRRGHVVIVIYAKNSGALYSVLSTVVRSAIVQNASLFLNFLLPLNIWVTADFVAGSGSHMCLSSVFPAEQLRSSAQLEKKILGAHKCTLTCPWPYLITHQFASPHSLSRGRRHQGWLPAYVRGSTVP